MLLGPIGSLLVAWLHAGPASADGVELPPPVPATADRTAIELEWSAPAGCPDADRFTRALGRLLATTIDLDPTAAVAVRGEIAAVAAGYELVLFVEAAGAIEERRLQAGDCGELGDAAALVVAITIDAARVADVLARPRPAAAIAPAPPSLPPTLPPREPVAPAPVVDAPEPTPASRVRFAMDVTTGVAVGLTPRVTPWLRGEFGVALARAKISATIGHAFARSSVDGDGPGARAQLTVGGLSGCYVATRKRLALPVCALVELGGARGVGTGTGIEPRPAWQLWAGAGASVAITYFPIANLGLVAGLDALVILRRPAFHVLDGGDRRQVYQAAPAAVRAVVGLAVRLP